MASYGTLETKFADLATDFGLEWATKLFGEEAIASLPVRASGKNKGKPKGYVIWRKCVVAGYCRDVCSPLAVGNLADAWIGTGAYTSRSDAVCGKWLGRVQPMGGSRIFMFEDGRAREAARQERERADDEARWAEFKAEAAAAKLSGAEG